MAANAELVAQSLSGGSLSYTQYLQKRYQGFLYDWLWGNKDRIKWRSLKTAGDDCTVAKIAWVSLKTVGAT